MAGAGSELIGYNDVRDGNMNKREKNRISTDNDLKRGNYGQYKPFKAPGKPNNYERQTKHEMIYKYLK